MKVLTLRQPWAWAIFAGKDVENRTWKTNHRGPLAIHAAKGMSEDEYEDIRLWIRDETGVTVPRMEDLVRGAIIGIVEVIDCVDNHPSPWFMGPYGFVLRNQTLLDNPIPHNGALSLWTPKNININNLLEETWNGGGAECSFCGNALRLEDFPDCKWCGAIGKCYLGNR
jgi:hypothetical protein